MTERQTDGGCLPKIEQVKQTGGGEERKIEVFQRKLAALINELSLENLSNTPDFILAGYLTDCLYLHARITNKRETWYGRPRKRCGTK